MWRTGMQTKGKNVVFCFILLSAVLGLLWTICL